jgi:hypothetical protein
MSVVFPSQCTEEMKSRPPQSPSSSPHQSVRGFRRAQLIWRAHGRGFPRGAARGGRTRASQTGQFPVPGDACGPGRRGHALHRVPGGAHPSHASKPFRPWSTVTGSSRGCPRSTRQRSILSWGANARAGQLPRSDRVLTASFSPLRPPPPPWSLHCPLCLAFACSLTQLDCGLDCLTIARMCSTSVRRGAHVNTHHHAG